MFVKQFEIHWSHLDVNRHVANITYQNFATETRMSCLKKYGCTQAYLQEQNIGPVMFAEEFYYVRELHHGQQVKVTLDLLAHSENHSYWKFAHRFYNDADKLCTYSEVFFGWIDLGKRKLITPPQLIIDIADKITKTDNFEILPDRINLKNPKIPFGKKLELENNLN